MTLIEALDLALKKETASIEIYRKMGREHPALKELCLFLENEEQKHKKMIEKKIVQLRLG
ncbi:MAG: hypothetical protein K9L86_06815 [Candidatus Omnitrophica bacterium]|nr:hypothetical protein [Candidatus Omnitrophota bacterium]